MKISVVIPAYKAEKTIKRCLLSILQNRKNEYEIIVVSDDESEERYDKLVSSIQEIADDSERSIICIRNRNAKGVSGARNTGIDYAKGDYLWFVDADDTVNPNWGDIWDEVQNKKSDVAIAAYEVFEFGNLANTRVPQLTVDEKNTQMISKDDFVKVFLWRCQQEWLLNPVWNKLYRRKVAEQIRFDEMASMGEDLLFNLIALDIAETVSMHSKTLYQYRTGEQESSCSKFYLGTQDTILKNWETEKKLYSKSGAQLHKSIIDGYVESLNVFEQELMIRNHGTLLQMCETRKKWKGVNPDTAPRMYDLRKYFDYKRKSITTCLITKTSVGKMIRRARYKFKKARKARQRKLWALNKVREYGVNPRQRIYCRIHCDNPDTGLFSYVNLFLAEFYTAEKQGWIPVADMQFFKSPYLRDEQLGQINAWDFYFQQPGSTNLDMIASSNNVVEVSCGESDYGPYAGAAFFDDRYGEKSFWRDYAKKHLLIKDSIRNQVENWYRTVFANEDRVLGILCRGTDYLRLRPTGHPIQPSVEMMLDKAENLVNEWKCNKLYLCTEDGEIIDSFQHRFRNKVIFYNREYVKDTGTDYVTKVRFDRDDDARLQGEEYLIQILLLTKCTCLLAGACGGTVGAEILSNGYEHEYIWDLGKYN